MAKTDKVKVAILREEGSNGDREMAAAIHSAGMEEPWDVTMSDLLAGKATLEDFRGVVFCGGFSYADVLDSAKGWAGSIRFNDELWAQFRAFYDRPDTFSLGICNGCQLMALLGFVPAEGARRDARRRATQVRAQRLGAVSSPGGSLSASTRTPRGARGHAGSRMGVWVAHGEGKVTFPDPDAMGPVVANGRPPCAPTLRR